MSFNIFSLAWVDVVSSGSVPMTATALAAALGTIKGPDNSTVSVAVSSVVDGSGTTWSVTFLSPVGPVPYLMVADNTQGSGHQWGSGSSCTGAYCVTREVAGQAPSTGTFTVMYENAYTRDIPYNAGAAEVKAAIEALSNVGTVQVTRDDTNNGYKWTVAFTQNSGNLRMMVASPYRYEVQQIQVPTYNPNPPPPTPALHFRPPLTCRRSPLPSTGPCCRRRAGRRPP